jgi:RNA polymerase sigma-70 factor (ECF subfamily)
MEISRLLQRARTTTREQAREEAGVDLAALYDAYAAPLYRYLHALLSRPEEAEDALQEVFLGVLRRTGRGRITDPRAYLFRAARNQAFMVLRKRRTREKTTEAATAFSWIDLEACAPAQREIAIDIDRALRRLAAEQREIILLRLSEDLTFREIAELLGLPRATAASRYRLALERLRSLLRSGDGHER